MPEFYKYAERNVGSQVNWAGLGVDMAETINAEEKIREDKRVAIDDATNKTLEYLANVPKGEEPNGNRLVADYSDNMTQAMLIQHKLLKSGRLNPKDYMLFNANAMSGTKQLFNLQTEYQKQYGVSMERRNKGESQAAEVDLKAHLETFGDLSKMKPIIDPRTGQVNLGIMEFDKNNVLQPTGQIISVQGAYKGLSQKFDKFDVMGASKKIADSLATVVQTDLLEGSLTQSGQLITLDYALQKPETQKALDGYVNAQLVNPYNTSSILTDDIGTYDNVFSNDSSEKSSGDKIVWHIDNYGAWKPEFTKEQTEAAREYLKNKAVAQLSEKQEIKTFESAQYKLEELKVKQRNATTAERNAATKAQGGGAEKGPSWYDWNDKRLPTIGTGKLVNETFIREAKKNFASLGLDFISEGKKAGETVIIVDKDTGNKDASGNIIPDKSPVFDLKAPNARESILDYIMVKKSHKAKDLVGTGVIDKKNMDQGGAPTYHYDADGNLVFD